MSYFRDIPATRIYLDRFKEEFNERLETCYNLEFFENLKIGALFPEFYKIEFDYYIPAYGKEYNEKVKTPSQPNNRREEFPELLDTNLVIYKCAHELEKKGKDLNIENLKSEIDNYIDTIIPNRIRNRTTKVNITDLYTKEIINEHLNIFKQNKKARLEKLTSNLYQNVIGKVSNFFNNDIQESQSKFIISSGYFEDYFDFPQNIIQIMFVLKLVSKMSKPGKRNLGCEDDIRDIVKGLYGLEDNTEYVISKIVCYTSGGEYENEGQPKYFNHYSLHSKTHPDFEGMKLNSILYYIYLKSGKILYDLGKENEKITHFSSNTANAIRRKICAKVDIIPIYGTDYVIDYERILVDDERSNRYRFTEVLFYRRNVGAYEDDLKLLKTKFSQEIKKLIANASTDTKKHQPKTKAGSSTFEIDTILQNRIIEQIEKKGNGAKSVFYKIGEYTGEFYIFNKQELTLVDNPDDIKKKNETIDKFFKSHRSKHLLVLKRPVGNHIPEYHNVVSEKLTSEVLNNTIKKADSLLKGILTLKEKDNPTCDAVTPLGI